MDKRLFVAVLHVPSATDLVFGFREQRDGDAIE